MREVCRCSTRYWLSFLSLPWSDHYQHGHTVRDGDTIQPEALESFFSFSLSFSPADEYRRERRLRFSP
jgi:hypothetical protein